MDHPSYQRVGGLYADAFGVYGDNQARRPLLHPSIACTYGPDIHEPVQLVVVLTGSLWSQPKGTQLEKCNASEVGILL